MLDEREEVERGNAGGRPEGGRSPTGGLPPAGASEFLPARNNSGVLPTREPTGSGLETESRSTGRIYLSGILPPGAIPAHPGLPPCRPTPIQDISVESATETSSGPEYVPDDMDREDGASFAEEFPEVGEDFLLPDDLPPGADHTPIFQSSRNQRHTGATGATGMAGIPGMAGPNLSSPLEEDSRRARQKLGTGKSRSLSKEISRTVYKPEQRILLLDTWLRSGLPCKDFAALVGISPHTLYKWHGTFEKDGPAGLMDKPKGPERGSQLPEITKRMILMLKKSNPEAGCQMISDLLARGPGVPASATAVARVLKEAGYEYDEVPTTPHPDKQRRFERERPNMMWQTDIFTFTLKRQNRRVHLVAFMDDHSRFITGYALRGMASSEMVMEALRAAVAAFNCPDELLTDNGPQYITWRGKSKFSKLCENLGIIQVVSRPRHPQTLGKIERFWRTLWEGFLSTAVFLDLEDASRRIGLFIDHYNFQRPHSSLGEGLVPADRFFGVAPEVLASMKQRMQQNALEIAKKGFPKQPFYLTGQVDGLPFSLHEENGRVYMTKQGGERHEVELVTPFGADEEERNAALDQCDFDGSMKRLAEGLDDDLEGACHE